MELDTINKSGAFSYIHRRGFDRLQPDTMGTIDYTDSTRTMSIAPKSGQSSFSFWAGGKYFEKTSAESVIWDNVSGTYYFAYDTSGVLHAVEHSAITETIFKTYAIVGLLYWNAVEGMSYKAVDEQHGIEIPASCHFNLHTTIGFNYAKYMGGGELVGMADASDTYTKITQGVWFDEDIPITIEESTGHRFMYRSGANGEWTLIGADNKTGYIESGNTYVSFNVYDSGSSEWVLQESTNTTDYIIYYFLATNLVEIPMVKIIGQQAFASRADARNALKYQLHTIYLEGLPSAEAQFAYAYICKRNGKVEDDGKGNAYVDLRGLPVNSI